MNFPNSSTTTFTGKSGLAFNVKESLLLPTIWTKIELKNLWIVSVSEWDSIISHDSNAFLEQLTHKAPFLQSRASNKIMSAHLVEKNGMWVVDEKQVISL